VFAPLVQGRKSQSRRELDSQLPVRSPVSCSRVGPLARAISAPAAAAGATRRRTA